ncbi:hypothetical protein HMPREF1321_0197 [Capnocytophaga sp. oral taxon 412 str. F0487]|nr:hypothetical protein HMPREF1321_0197 [Capnocytophaga sp. oral taxon 412 str. F0487]
MIGERIFCSSFPYLPVWLALVEYTFSLFTFHFSLLFVPLPPKNI